MGYGRIFWGGLILDQGVSEGFQKEGMFKMHSEMSS